MIVEGVSVLSSIAKNDWSWFSRSGSVIGLVGGFLAARKIFRQGVESLYVGATTIDGGDFETNEDLEKELQQVREDIVCAKLGGLLLIVGTLIWGYGDLLGHVFPH